MTPLDCGCTHVALMAYLIDCDACGLRVEGEAELPSSGRVGEVTPIFGSCECGGEAHGSARVIGILA